MLNYVLSLTSDALYKKYANNITKFYHENYNGTGYPNNLKGDNIPLEAQIAAICINYNNLSKKSKENAERKERQIQRIESEQGPEPQSAVPSQQDSEEGSEEITEERKFVTCPKCGERVWL